MIEIKDLSITLNTSHLLKDVNLTFETGRCYGLIGRNGAGKSLLFKTLIGLMPLQGGNITIDGQPLTKGHFLKDAGIIIENPQFISNLTGFENLKLLAEIQKTIDYERIKDILLMVGLSPELPQKYKNYSLGMKQRLRIAQAIMEDPKYYILDEPFNGLDEQGVKEIHEIIKQLKQKDKIILLTSHDERDIDSLCDKVFKIEGGTIHEI
ncbi:ABC-2 type transport system ATP-binding protein [Enterococcus sp. AZ194]|uniref:ABC transporter ATP-binding protein n=1 Tax=Enterococcus sp. AZ194 TaxID=2774629 RepID=UPI003F22465C